MNDSLKIRRFQQIGNRIDDPSDSVVNGRTGDLGEHIAEEGRCLGESGGLPAEGLVRLQAAGGEQPVGDGLRLHIGELLVRDRIEERVLVHLVEMRQLPAVVLVQCPFHGGAQQSRLCSHGHGEVFGRLGACRLDGRERAEQLLHFFDAALPGRPTAVTRNHAQRRGFDQRAVPEPMELQIVGQDQVRQRMPIARDLPAVMLRGQRNADVLAFDVADRAAAPGYDDVGRAHGDMLGFVDRADPRARDRLEQRLKVPAIRMLGGLLRPERLAHARQIGAKVRGETGHVRASLSALG